MRNCIRCVACFFVLIGAVEAQVGGSSGIASQDLNESSAYLLQVTEFRMPVAASELKLDATQLAKALTKPTPDHGLELIENIRLTMRSESESMVQVGRTVAIVNGKTMQRNGVGEPSYLRHPVGTIIKAMPNFEGSSIFLTLTYEASRVEESKIADRPADIVNMQYKGILKLEPGKPILVGGVDGPSGSLLLVSMQQQN